MFGLYKTMEPPDILQKYELSYIRKVLNGLQIRADGLIYSKENPLSEVEDLNPRLSSQESLRQIFGVNHIDNVAVDLILKEVHHNYLALAKEVIIIC